MAKVGVAFAVIVCALSGSASAQQTALAVDAQGDVAGIPTLVRGVEDIETVALAVDAQGDVAAFSTLVRGVEDDTSKQGRGGDVRDSSRDPSVWDRSGPLASQHDRDMSALFQSTSVQVSMDVASEGFGEEHHGTPDDDAGSGKRAVTGADGSPYGHTADNRPMSLASSAEGRLEVAAAGVSDLASQKEMESGTTHHGTPEASVSEASLRRLSDGSVPRRRLASGVEEAILSEAEFDADELPWLEAEEEPDDKAGEMEKTEVEEKAEVNADEKMKDADDEAKDKSLEAKSIQSSMDKGKELSSFTEFAITKDVGWVKAPNQRDVCDDLHTKSINNVGYATVEDCKAAALLDPECAGHAIQFGGGNAIYHCACDKVKCPLFRVNHRLEKERWIWGSVDIQFQQGSAIGFRYNAATGYVRGVESSVASRGVEVGWVMSTINGKPYTEELMFAARKGVAPYTVTFVKDGEECNTNDQCGTGRAGKVCIGGLCKALNDHMCCSLQTCDSCARGSEDVDSSTCSTAKWCKGEKEDTKVVDTGNVQGNAFGATFGLSSFGLAFFSIALSVNALP